MVSVSLIGTIDPRRGWLETDIRLMFAAALTAAAATAALTAAAVSMALNIGAVETHEAP